jgi:transcription antitermination factor NusG
MEQPWRVLHVVTNHEKKVSQHLAARCIEHYLPLYSTISQWTDRMARLERPLFSGYLFLRNAHNANYPSLAIRGVLRLLGNSETCSVSNAEIERIRAALVQRCPIRPCLGVSSGSRVRIRHGIFAGIEGIVTDLRRQCKVVIALSSTARFFSIETNIDNIDVLHRV